MPDYSIMTKGRRVRFKSGAPDYSKTGAVAVPSAPAWAVAIICALAPTAITLLLVGVAAFGYKLLHDDASFLYIMLFIVGVD
jgi:hypothetical protein